MDPIAETVMWGVIWFFGGSLITGLLALTTVGIGILLASLTDKEGFAVVAVPIAWIVAVVWEIFVFYQVIMHAINLFQLIAVGV